MFVRVVGVRYDRIHHYELFDIDDVDRALARFAELDAGKDTVRPIDHADAADLAAKFRLKDEG